MYFVSCPQGPVGPPGDPGLVGPKGLKVSLLSKHISQLVMLLRSLNQFFHTTV